MALEYIAEDGVEVGKAETVNRSLGEFKGFKSIDSVHESPRVEFFHPTQQGLVRIHSCSSELASTFSPSHDWKPSSLEEVVQSWQSGYAVLARSKNLARARGVLGRRYASLLLGERSTFLRRDGLMRLDGAEE